MNLFLRLEGFEPPPMPNRLYARIDQIEPVSKPPAEGLEPPEGERIPLYLMFDSVDANWFDEVRREAIGDEAFFEGIRLAVLAIETEREPDPVLGAINGITVKDEENDDPEWFEILVHPEAKGPTATLYQNLFTAGTPTQVEKVAPVPEDIRTRLDDEFSLDDEDDATEEEIAEAISLRDTIDFAAVYDVGQGNCNGFCAADAGVTAYFDLGGGVMANKKTFPRNLTKFCFTKEPPIVLSHWDWDHWSSGNRDQRAQHLTWIVPRQKLGGVHRTFASNVKANGSLVVWPRTGLSEVSVDQITIKKCTGNGANHSGLAVILRGDGAYSRQYMLFTGDARYNVIPDYKKFDFTAVVAPHHGADMRSHYAPPCPGQSHERLAYSYGPKNTFQHARAVTRNDHNQRGWHDKQVANVPGRPDLVRQTAERNKVTDLGHIMLRWSSSQASPTLPCGGACQLEIQRI